MKELDRHLKREKSKQTDTGWTGRQDKQLEKKASKDRQTDRQTDKKRKRQAGELYLYLYKIYHLQKN